MSELVVCYEYLLFGAALMLLLLGLGIAVNVPTIDRWSKRFFIAFFSVLLVYGGLVLPESIAERMPNMRSALLVIYYFETLTASFLPPMMLAYLLHCCGEDLKNSRLFKLEMSLWIVFFIMIDISPFTDRFYYITAENQFFRGPLYPLMTATLAVMILFTLGGVIHGRKKLSKRYYRAFLLGLVPLTVALCVHFFVSVFAFLGFGVALCAFSMYVIILSDQVEQTLLQQRELARQRASVMVLQMRPHFIYNTLMSIYSLCNQDPKKARQVTLDFTNYLRKNFNAVASEIPIPFLAELEHTRAYLAVEQARFEDMLLVEYDTPFTQFRLPPLTLQPIAENSVKHGMNPYSGPLRIFIQTRHADGCAVVIIKDNGSGFDPVNDHEPHSALTNIRQRLEMMCGGKLEVTSEDGGGTTVTLTIPDRTGGE